MKLLLNIHYLWSEKKQANMPYAIFGISTLGGVAFGASDPDEE